MTTAELLRLRLPCDATAPRLARQAVSTLPQIESVRDDVLLVVSELTSNAVRHSGSSAEEEFELLAERTGDRVRIVVIDSGRSETTPVRLDGHPLEPGGLGLRVVESLARDWGSARDGRLQVWAELEVH